VNCPVTNHTLIVCDTSELLPQQNLLFTTNLRWPRFAVIHAGFSACAQVTEICAEMSNDSHPRHSSTLQLHSHSFMQQFCLIRSDCKVNEKVSVQIRQCSEHGVCLYGFILCSGGCKIFQNGDVLRVQEKIPVGGLENESNVESVNRFSC